MTLLERDREKFQEGLAGKYDTWQRQGEQVNLVSEKSRYDFPRIGEEKQSRVCQEKRAEEDRISVYPDMPSVRGKNRFTTTYTHNWDHEAVLVPDSV